MPSYSYKGSGFVVVVISHIFLLWKELSCGLPLSVPLIRPTYY